MHFTLPWWCLSAGLWDVYTQNEFIRVVGYGRCSIDLISMVLYYRTPVLTPDRYSMYCTYNIYCSVTEVSRSVGLKFNLFHDSQLVQFVSLIQDSFDHCVKSDSISNGSSSQTHSSLQSWFRSNTTTSQSKIDAHSHHLQFALHSHSLLYTLFNLETFSILLWSTFGFNPSLSISYPSRRYLKSKLDRFHTWFGCAQRFYYHAQDG